MDPEPVSGTIERGIGDARLDAVVEGSGPVTVIFENGPATALEAWDAISPQIEARARVVRYDRRRAAPGSRGARPRVARDWRRARRGRGGSGRFSQPAINASRSALI